MKMTESMSIADFLKFKPDSPELYAYNCSAWNYNIRKWTNRKALVTTINMQRKRARNSQDWIPFVPVI